MAPPYSNFIDGDTPGSCDEQQFDIVGEAVDALYRSQGATEPSGKELKTALGIDDARECERLLNEIEGSSHEIPVPGLPDLDQITIDGARSDHDRGVRTFDHESVEFFNRSRQVGITDQQVSAVGIAETGTDSSSFAVILRMVDDGQSHTLGERGCEGNLRGAIRRPVVDHNDLAGQCFIAQVPED